MCTPHAHLSVLFYVSKKSLPATALISITAEGEPKKSVFRHLIPHSKEAARYPSAHPHEFSLLFENLLRRTAPYRRRFKRAERQSGIPEQPLEREMPTVYPQPHERCCGLPKITPSSAHITVTASRALAVAMMLHAFHANGRCAWSARTTTITAFFCRGSRRMQ
jgi:hypothetical protein